MIRIKKLFLPDLTLKTNFVGVYSLIQSLRQVTTHKLSGYSLSVTGH